MNGGRTVACNTGAGNWLSYTVDVASAGTYDIVISIASGSVKKTVHFEVDGVDVTGPIGGAFKNWDNFVETAKAGVALTAGRHVLRVCEDTGGYDIDYIRVVPAAASPSATPPKP